MTDTSYTTVLRRLAAADPERAAITCAGETLSRMELLDGVENLAAHMAELGVAEGATVTVALPNSLDFALALFATWHLGATPQIVSHRLPDHEYDAILDLASPSLVVGDAGLTRQGVRTLSSADVRALADKRVDRVPDRVSPTWKIVTSGGSTGRPKLIAATQPAAFESLAPFAALLRFPEDGAVLVTGPLSHNAPLVVLTAGLLLGNHTIVMPRFDATETMRLVEQHRVNWLYLVPTMMLRIWRLPDDERRGFDVSSVDVAFHMAAPCPPWLKRAWIEWLGAERVLELYGGTELQAMTVVTGTEWLEHPGSVGRPVIGEIEVRGNDGGPVPAGEIGELWLRRGAAVEAPYRYIGATPRRAADGWESLGDMGYMDADGFVYITDRNTDMILVGGANVYPAEIEAALDEHAAVRSSCVIGLPDDDLGNVPHALVQLAPDAAVTDEELLEHLRARVATYKLPRTIERVSEPIRDDAGKVRRSALRAERLARG